MLTAIAYNKTELKLAATKEDTKIGYNLWVDLVNPTQTELSRVRQDFQLDESALEEYQNKSKKPQVRFLDKQKFAVALDIKFHDSSTLVTESVYLFVGSGWLVTLHSDRVDLRTRILALIKQKNIGITESSVDVLFYTILANLVQS